MTPATTRIARISQKLAAPCTEERRDFDMTAIAF
jgi:hypothetical protein